MELNAKGSFYRDLSRFSNRELAKEVRGILERIIRAQNISQIPNLKKLKKFEVHYRLKVMKDYRIGMVIRNTTITLVCFGHRNSIYKKFP